MINLLVSAIKQKLVKTGFTVLNNFIKLLYFQSDPRTLSECESSSIRQNLTALERKLQGDTPSINKIN